MRQFVVTGMSCAACQVRVEKAVSRVPGVTECTVSLLTNSMRVEGTANDTDIIKAVSEAGYSASLRGGKGKTAASDSEELLKDRETPALKKRLLSSLFFLIILMYFSMGHHMWGWPIPSWFNGNPTAVGMVQLILCSIVLIINRKFFISGFNSVLHGAPNMDTLVALGSSASFCWSIYALFMMSDAQVRSGSDTAAAWMDQFYFESAAMILVLITVGKLLEARSKGKTTDALKSLMKLTPKTAQVIRNGSEMTVSVEDVRKGDIFVVRPGESIPADGVILEGSTAVNESALTGESIPADKAPGDEVSAATINQSGFIRCEATRVGEDTTLSQIIKLVSDAAATKAPIAKTADKVSGIFVPAVTGIAVITLIVWLIIGEKTDYALARAISVLVISCPCALGLATPVAIMVGSGAGAKHGILFKTAVSLEETGKTQIVVLDKTGTITRGEPEVTEIIPAGGISEDELLTAAFGLEALSEHPLSRAIVHEAEQRGLTAPAVHDFQAHPGNGLSAVLGQEEIIGGSVPFIRSKCEPDQALLEEADRLSNEGSTPMLFCRGGKLLGIISAADTIKEGAPEAILEMKKMGLQVVMLTGDNLRTASSIGKKAGIDHVIAGVLPDGKEAVIRRLKELGKITMVGDGINDAPALTSADTGIAIGAGTDVAIDAADIVLISSSLRDVPAAIKLSRQTLKNIRENLFWAFFYNALCIPLAAGCYIRLFGWELNPMIGAAAMSLSSFCVVSNALRLNLFDMYSSKHNKKAPTALASGALVPLLEEINTKTEDIQMTKTMKIDGMMCSHCEARVKKTLEAIDGVESASADHVSGKAVVTLSKDVDNEILKAAVEAQDYAVLGIE
ncbi:MAG: heavy metal translocating P-type ATPase [Eubacteriales bacterium]|nr:heavy metal translocating P-type ATPase [Eubacteriales bacterium]